MKHSLIPPAMIFSALMLTLSGCTTTPHAPSATTTESASSVVAFIDLDQFDRQLSTSLSAPLPEVEVPFYERVSPNKIPPRMKVWLNHIENNGGRIQIQEPPNESGVNAKNPFLIFSIINALKTLSNLSAKETQEKNFFQHIKGHDAKVILSHNADHVVVVDKVIFIKSSKP